MCVCVYVAGNLLPVSVTEEKVEVRRKNSFRQRSEFEQHKIAINFSWNSLDWIVPIHKTTFQEVE